MSKTYQHMERIRLRRHGENGEFEVLPPVLEFGMVPIDANRGFVPACQSTFMIKIVEKKTRNISHLKSFNGNGEMYDRLLYVSRFLLNSIEKNECDD